MASDNPNPSRFRAHALIALVILSVVAAVVFSISAYGSLQSPNSGELVVLELHPYVGGRESVLGKNLVATVLITAPLPPDMVKGAGRDTEVVFAGVVHRSLALTREEIGPIIDGWVRTYRDRGSNPPYIGLTIHIDVVERATGRPIASGIDSVTLNTELLSRGYVGYYKLGMSIPSSGTGGVARVGVAEIHYYDRFTAPSISHENPVNYAQKTLSNPFSGIDELSGYDYCIPLNLVTYRCYNLTYYAGVETLEGVLPSDYFKEVGGVKYMKVPVLIAENDFPLYSAAVAVAIGASEINPAIGIYPTYTIGPNIAKAIKTPNYPVFPSVTIWKGNGLVWGGEQYNFGRILVLHPAGERSSGWVWVWARPYAEIYSVYDVWLEHGANYFHDEVTMAISDVLVEGDNIESGEEYGLPDDSLMQLLFSGTNETEVTRLGPGESITFDQIFQTCDTCGADFEVGIPVGAMAALAAEVTTGGLATPVAAGLSGFQVTLSAVGASIHIYGIIDNEGDDPGYAGDHDTVEIVYMRVSRFKYRADPPWWCFWCSPCYYDVPAGIYFRFW